MIELQRLVHEIVREQDDHRDADRCRVRVRRRLALTKVPHRKRQVLSWQALAWAACCAAILTAWVLGWNKPQPSEISAIAGASSSPVVTGAWLNASETSSLPVRFSDGTHVEVAPRAMLRVLELGTSTVRLALESGRIEVEVRHSTNRHWEWRAGAFIVRATGTRFSLSWQSNADSLELVIHDGQVELSGCGFGDARMLTAGRTVRASCRDGAVEVSSRAQQSR